MNAMKPICTRCGNDVALDAPIALGKFTMGGPDQPLYYDGKLVGLTAGEAMIAWSLLKSAPHTLKSDVLLDRMDSRGGYNVVTVLVHRIRAKVRAAGASDPIQNLSNSGYRWIA